MDFNVAFNRPTFAISEHTHSTFGTFSSSKAVDGNKDGFLWKTDNSCFRSQLLTDNPWWAVDLGAALAVVGVLFTPRNDGGNVSTLYFMTYIYAPISTIASGVL